MESLDLLGIDIDQDPRAFPKFLKLKNLMPWSKPATTAGSRSPVRVYRVSVLS
jgi:hypothetical protein